MLNPAAVAVPLLAAERRQVDQSDAMTAAADLNQGQTSLEVGQSIPVVFGKRSGGAGGVWISAAASECRFENDSVNRVTASYLIVPCTGQLPTIAVGDIYQGDTPLVSGEFLQAFNGRAGTWLPGNFIQQKFNVTSSYQEIKLEGKRIGNEEFLDISEFGVTELAQEIADAVATGTIKSNGNYLTQFNVTVSKAISWNKPGMIRAQLGPDYYAVSFVNTGNSGGMSVMAPSLPSLSFYESRTWAIAYSANVPYTYAPRIGGTGHPWSVLLDVSNQWIYDRADQGRHLNFNGYFVSRPASTEPYGDIEIEITEAIRGGFLMAETVSFPCSDGTYTAGLFGGLASVTYTLTVTEENSEPYPKPEATLYCGTGGSYAGVTTISVTKQYPAENEGWRRQVHFFARECPPIYRVIEGTNGSSNLFPDLARYALLATNKIEPTLLDDASFITAARFNLANNITCDGRATVPANVPEWLDRMAPLFLLTPTNHWGKIGLRPSVPITTSYAFDTSPITPVAIFDESNIEPGSFTAQGVTAEDRNWRVGILPLWREQPENGLGLVRGTGPVRFSDVPDSAPVETVDASEWVTRELHGVRLAALELARRRHIEHTATIATKPTTAIAAIRPGDIVQINLARIPTVGNPGEWSYFYTVLNIGGPPMGPWQMQLEHHPVDMMGRSLLARELAAANIA
jgi:hypothetical protein